MKRLQRARLLLNGLPITSALKCIVGLMSVRLDKKITSFSITYKKYGTRLIAQVRGEHLRSDLQSVLELAAGDCYQLSQLSWEPDMIIDGGGNTGLFSLVASARWPNSQIYCFEPMPENVVIIKKHISANHLYERVKLIPSAISGHTKTAKFFIRDANQGSLNNSLEFTNAIEVNVLRLWEQYLPMRDRHVLIKLDVEGAEFDILSDFFQQIPHQKLVMVMEVHGNKQEQDTLLIEAHKAGFFGYYWEQAQETAHLFLSSPDVELSALSPQL